MSKYSRKNITSSPIASSCFHYSIYSPNENFQSHTLVTSKILPTFALQKHFHWFCVLLLECKCCLLQHGTHLMDLLFSNMFFFSMSNTTPVVICFSPRNTVKGMSL